MIREEKGRKILGSAAKSESIKNNNPELVLKEEAKSKSIIFGERGKVNVRSNIFFNQ